MSNLMTRVITGIIFGVIVTGCVLFSEWTLALLLFIISLGGIREFYRIAASVNPVVKPQALTGIIISQVLLALYMLTELAYMPFHLVLLSIPLLALVFIIELYRNKEAPFVNIAVTLTGMAYVTLPMMLFFFIGVGFMPADETIYHGNLILGIFIMLWSNDTGAYFAGSKLGKNKLFERLSPKKTWEGFFGGMMAALIAAFIISRYFDDLDLAGWMISAVIIVVFGTLGDLAESMLKRSGNVKDSGNILPGHGGMLDRFDGLFIAIPFLFYYLFVTGKFS